MIPTRRLARLLILLPSTRMGGTERHTTDLAVQLARGTGLHLDLAAEPALHPALSPRLGPATLHAAALGWEAADAPLRQAAETRRLLAALRPDAAFVPLPWPEAATGILPALAEAALPRLVLLHLAPEAPAPALVPDLGLDGAIVAAVSAPIARRAACAWGLRPEAVAVLDNPAPRPAPLDPAVTRAAIRSGLGLTAGAPLLLFVGRLEQAKGADLLPALSGRLPHPLAVAGDGPLRGLLESHAAADPRGLMRILGPIGDPSPWMLAADALLLPSRLEGAPLVFLEAAAHRCPVVATSAALEAIGPEAGHLATLAATADAPGLAAAVEAALGDPPATTARASRAAAHAARLTPEAAIRDTLALLRAATLRAAPRRAA